MVDSMVKIRCSSLQQLHEIADALGAKIIYSQDCRRLVIPSSPELYPTFFYQVT